MPVLRFYMGDNMFLEVDKQLKACISEGVSLLMKTVPAEGEEDLTGQMQAKVLERIRMAGVKLTDAILKTRGNQDQHIFAQRIFKRLINSLGFLDTIREDWKETGKSSGFDPDFCDDLQASLRRKLDKLTTHIPSLLYPPYFTMANLPNALLETERFNKRETDGKVILARRLAYVFADLEYRGLLYKLPEEILFSYVHIYVDCTDDYIRRNLLSIRDGYKGDLARATAWMYMDEAREFIQRFNI